MGLLGGVGFGLAALVSMPAAAVASPGPVTAASNVHCGAATEQLHWDSVCRLAAVGGSPETEPEPQVHWD